MSSIGIKWSSFARATVVILSAFSVCLGILLVSPPAFAQLNYGRIYGAITDQTGGALAGAMVTVIDVDRGISRSLVADETGQFSASSLLPGSYTVRAAANGFKAAEHSGLTVGVGQDVRVDLTLQPGEQTQTVTVTGDVPMVNTTSATLGGTVENATIVELPLNGRAFQKLLDFSPGMQQVPGGGTPAYNVNGQRGTNITWMLDGVDEINMAGGAGPTVGGNGGGVDGVTILSLDAIQEVNTIQSPKAEYGWMAGSVVNIGLKSGTNSIHGTAFGFFRNGALDASNAFLGAGLSKATDNLKQYGGTIGGPIKKDKVFYFATYEGNRYTIGSPKTISEPSDAAGLGKSNSIPDAISNMIITGHALSPMSVKMAGCNYAAVAALTPATATPAAVAGLCGPGASGAPPSLFGNSSAAAKFPVAFNDVGGSDNGLAKIDYHISTNSTLNGEYFIGNGNVDNATAATSPFWLADNFFRTQTGRVVWVWTPKSSIVNEMRFGLLEYTQVGSPDDCNGNDGAPDYANVYGYNLGVTLPPPQCGMANVVITGFNNLGSQSTNGGPQDNHFSVWSGIDSVSYTRGNHLFKFGGEIHDTLFSGSKSLTNDNGTFNFGRIAAFTGATVLQDFLAGVASNGTILAGNATLSEALAYNRYALFAQDDWRIKPRITLNLGVRWEYVQPVTTPNNVLGNFNVGAPTGLVQEVDGKSVYTLPKDLFSPRLGVAWDVTGKGTTVIRAGGTYMHDFLVFQALLPNLQNVPTGFALVLPNGTLAQPQPGSNLLGTLALSGGTSGSAINWTGTGPVVSFTPNTVNSLGFACGNGLTAFGGGTPAPCNLNPPVTPQNGFKPDGVVSWNLSVQHAFGNNLSLNVAYVGTHGEDLRGTTDINQPDLGVANGSSGAARQNEQKRRIFTENCPTTFFGGLGLNPAQCFPYLGQVEENLPNEISNYNGLQVTLNKRISHGLQFNVGYTYAHALDEASGLSNSSNRDLMNTQNPLLDYGNAAFDARHHLTITGTYDIPGYKTKGQMLEGWQVNVAATILSALPFDALDSTDDLSGTGINQDRWNLLGDPGNFKGGTAAPIPCYGVTGSKFAIPGCTIVSSLSALPAECVTAASAAATNPAVIAAGDPNATGLQALANLGCYFQNGSAIVPAAQGTYGNMGRNVLRGRPFKETDLSVTKSWKFGERLTTQFRAEFFNIFNAVEFSSPGQSTNTPNLASPGIFGSSPSTPNTFSFIFGSGGPRVAQLGLKFIF